MKPEQHPLDIGLNQRLHTTKNVRLDVANPNGVLQSFHSINGTLTANFTDKQSLMEGKSDHMQYCVAMCSFTQKYYIIFTISVSDL